MKFVFYSLLAICVIFSCKNENKVVSTPTGEKIYGDSINAAGAINMAEMVTKMGTLDSLACKVTATPVAVCQNKGCWMQVTTNGITDTMMVNFKDYGFFMPKDIAGKEVVMKGKAYVEETSVEDLKHFAEDEGLTEAEIAKITEPKVELKFMASGVMIKP